MKRMYDPKYASLYKSKHTKHVKLSQKIRFLLDTQKKYPNREWSRMDHILFEGLDWIWDWVTHIGGGLRVGNETKTLYFREIE